MNFLLCIIIMIGFFCPIIYDIYILNDDNFTDDLYILVVWFLIFSLFVFVCFIGLANHFVSIGIFEKDKVIVKCIFRKTYSISYDKFKDVGIGYYTHGVLNSSLGSNVSYIYFACGKLKDEQKYNINLLKPSKSFVKLGFSKKNYDDMIEVLPAELSDMLKDSYEELKSKKILK